MDYLQDLLKPLGGFAIIVLAVAWLVREIVARVLDKDVEGYKSRLEIESARLIEQFKAQLQVTMKEHEIRFVKLHEKRVQILADLYHRLQEARGARLLVEFLVEQGKDHSELQERVGKIYAKCAELDEMYNKNKLYLPTDVSLQVEQLLSAMVGPIQDFQVYLHSPDILRDHMQEILSAIQTRQVDFSGALASIESEFRTILGGTEA